MLSRLFVVAVLFNYLWELAQSPLYAGMEDFSRIWWHCLGASLGDGLLVLLIFLIGWILLRREEWFSHPGVSEYAMMLTTGLVLAISIEWVAVHLLGRWAYTAQMPIVPKLGVGIVPILQMIVLPPVIFRVVATWRHSL